MRFPTDIATFSAMLTKLPQDKIAKVICALLLGYIAYLFAQLTWLLVPQSENRAIGNTAIKHTVSTSGIKASQVDVAALLKLNLFGVYNEQPKVVEVKVQDAPETSLRLTLSGTVASDDPQIAAAIIENNGKQETYGIGDKITGTRATLESVAHDRVLIKQSGRLETLMLDGFKYSKASSSLSVPMAPVAAEPVNKLASAQVIDQRENTLLAESAKQLKEDISEDPGKIVDHLKISPKRRDGEIVGYQLMPGNNPEFFKASGLKSGDIAIQMNGLDLTLPSEAAEALQALKQDTDVSLLVERDGEVVEILFSIEQ